MEMYTRLDTNQPLRGTRPPHYKRQNFIPQCMVDTIEECHCNKQNQNSQGSTVWGFAPKQEKTQHSLN